MNIFDDYTRSLLEKLNEKEVAFLVVGGYAVNYHGYRRTTGDIDLWIKPDNTINKEKIIECLRILGVEEKNLARLNQLDFSKPIVFIDGEEPFKIDFMTYVNGVNFNDAWAKRNIANLDGIEIPFIHLNDLILTKVTTARPQDKIDVEKLQKINEHKKTND